MSAATLFAGRYRLERPLGHGGMAVVERAEDVELKRTVAVKLLADNLARDAELRRRFLREAQLAAGLAHPNVVRVFDTGEAAGRPYIVMEYVEGETVAELLARERRLPEAQAVDIAIQACAGLEAAHAAGLVHRDVKPQNLLLRVDGVVKVADFGIARPQAGTRLTAAGTVLGTAAYIAPEQVTGGEITAAVDVYALGAVLYELLTGRPPRHVETLGDLAASLERPIVPVRDLAPDISPALELVVMRCLARLPEHRPTSAAALARELAGAAADAPLRATEVRATSRLHRSRNRRLPIVAASATLAALGIGLGVGLSSRGGSSPRPPAPILPVPHSSNPAREARNLSAWLRRNSR